MQKFFIISGIILIFIGIVVLITGVILQSLGGEKGETKSGFGGVVMIGPIPIGFGTDKEMMIFAMILAIILMVLAFLFFNVKF